LRTAKDVKGNQVLNRGADKHGLSARRSTWVFKLARTIADLETKPG